MKIWIHLLLLMLLCDGMPANAQLIVKTKLSTHFLLPGINMTLSNNFVHGTHKYTPTYIALPYDDEYFTVYGKQTILSGFKSDSTLDINEYSGSFYWDTSRVDANAFLFENLQSRYFINGTLVSNWQYIDKMPSFKDSAIKFKTAPHELGTGFWMVKDSLNIGDSMLIEFRRNNGAPFLRLHLKRENAYTQPFMMCRRDDSSHAELSFISSELLQQDNQVYNSLFYHDWPGSGLACNNLRISARNKMAFYFRKDNDKSKDSIFLYRILGGRYKDTSWQKTDGLVLMTALNDNAHYRLEVKYADGRGTLSTYTFYTPPLWYQTTWFKVMLIAIATILLLLLAFISRVRNNKRRIKYLQLEMQALHAQMNPHFLFNALSSIQGLMNDGQTDKANKYLSGFAALLRGAVSQGSKEFVPLSVELKNLNNYIELERLRFGFQYSNTVVAGLPADEINMLPLLAQPLIENAAKHGLSGKRDNGILHLDITREQTDLLIWVTDNGIGFDTRKPPAGRGISLTQERIALFNRMNKHRKIILDISSSAEGTRCCIRFKNWMDND